MVVDPVAVRPKKEQETKKIDIFNVNLNSGKVPSKDIACSVMEQTGSMNPGSESGELKSEVDMGVCLSLQGGKINEKGVRETVIPVIRGCVNITCGMQTIPALIDTGATASFISPKLIHSLQATGVNIQLTPTRDRVVLADNKSYKVYNKASFPFSIESAEYLNEIRRASCRERV